MEAPVYSKEELEEKLSRLRLRVNHLRDLAETIVGALGEAERWLEKYLEPRRAVEYCTKLYNESNYIEQLIYDAVDELVQSELKADPDVEKYEEQYGVDFGYGEERVIGVVMLKEGEAVKPVVIWTDYRELGYWRGTKR